MSLGKRLIATDAAGGIVGTDNFNTVTYIGNGGTQAITTVGFQPDFVWIKTRSDIGGSNHFLFDSIRGATNRVFSNLINNEAADADSLTSFNSNGFTVDDDISCNGSGESIVAWNWKAAASNATNNDGTTTSTVRANTAAGFSIVKFAATNTSIQVGHGLTASPNLIIYKNLDTADNWYVYHSGLTSPNTQWLKLNSQDAVVTSGTYNFSAVTSSTFTSHLWAGAGSNDIIAYCFADISNYQKIGTYNGSGSAGKRVYTDSNGDGTGTGGFQPRFVLIKCTTNGSTDWLIFTSNVVDGSGNPTMIRANTTDSEFTGDRLQFTSDGFTLSDNDGSRNGSSRTYLYWAIA